MGKKSCFILVSTRSKTVFASHTSPARRNPNKLVAFSLQRKPSVICQGDRRTDRSESWNSYLDKSQEFGVLKCCNILRLSKFIYQSLAISFQVIYSGVPNCCGCTLNNFWPFPPPTLLFYTLHISTTINLFSN